MVVAPVYVLEEVNVRPPALAMITLPLPLMTPP